MLKKTSLFIHLLFFLGLLPGLQGQNIITSAQGNNDEVFWQQALGGWVTGPPTSQAESVVMVTDGGNIKAYNWEGKTLWDFFARGRLQPYITRSMEGTTYVCRTNGNLIAVNRSGRELWQINLREPLAVPVMLGWDGRLFVITNRRIICFTASGYQLWLKDIEKTFALKPALDGKGGFLFVFEDGELWRIDAFGKVIIDYLESIPIAAIPIESLETTNILLVYPSGLMELLESANGNREKLTRISSSANPVAAAGMGSNAAILFRNGLISYYNITEQELLWTGETHLSQKEISEPSFETNFFIDERGIYVLTQYGAAAFNDEGQRLWQIRLQGAASLPAFSDEGILYSGGTDWILHAYRLEERKLVRKHLLYGPAPPGIYGTGIPQPEFWANYPLRYSELEMDLWFKEIENAIRQGQVGEKEKEYAYWLMDIAGSSSKLYHLDSPTAEMHPPVLVLRRAQAIRLLSFIGSRETVPFLANIFIRDNEPVMKSAAAEALGRIGADPEGIAFRAFTNALFSPGLLKDDHILTSIASATGAISRFSGPPLSETGIRILTLLAAYDKPHAARVRAQREIKTLR